MFGKEISIISEPTDLNQLIPKSHAFFISGFSPSSKYSFGTPTLLPF